MTNVVPIGSQLAKDMKVGVDEAIAHLQANRANIKSMVIVLGDGQGFSTWLGPDPESVSFATDFVKAILADTILQSYGL